MDVLPKLFFKSSLLLNDYCGIQVQYVPQTAAMTFAFSPVFIFLLHLRPNPHGCEATFYPLAGGCYSSAVTYIVQYVLYCSFVIMCSCIKRLTKKYRNGNILFLGIFCYFFFLSMSISLNSLFN